MGQDIEAGALLLSQLDTEAMRRLLAGEPVDPSLTWAAGYPLEGSRVGLRAHLDQAASGLKAGPFGWYEIILVDARLVIGDINCHEPPDATGVVVIGCQVATSQRGRGHGTAAVRALCRWLLDRPEVSSVQADVAADNLASRTMVERAGMREVTTVGQTVYYRIP